MELLSFPVTPFQIELCFHSAIERLEHQAAASPDSEKGIHAQALLQEIGPYPELRNGLTSAEQVTMHEGRIRRLLADYFPPELSGNEIKGVNIPYANVVFNKTKRFRRILEAAGPGFDVAIRDFDAHQFYVLSCCLILNEHYGTKLDFSRPLFYDIPTEDGILKHYRILYNADFLEILPTERSLPLSGAEIDLLMDSYDNLALWKEKFPPGSWKLRGFAIMTLVDVTIENAVSIFKEKLLGVNTLGIQQSIESIFRSIYRIADLRVGFSIFNPVDGRFGMENFEPDDMQSFILDSNGPIAAAELFRGSSYQCLMHEAGYFAVANIDEFLKVSPDSILGQRFAQQGIRSFIIAPVVKNDTLLGVLEVVSIRHKELNSINANKLDVVMPFLTETVERLMAELQNHIQAVIQEKYTTIHESVYWRFREEAERYVSSLQRGKTYTPHEIVFADVYPLYGQVDIKGSSEARNRSVQKDLQHQLEALMALWDSFRNHPAFAGLQTEEQRLNEYLLELSLPLRAGTEQYIYHYLDEVLHPGLRQIQAPALQPAIEQYFQETIKSTGEFHAYRRQYEKTIARINDTLVTVVDRRQIDAQALFPHYFERFKTDGVDHSLYIGSSISPRQSFQIAKLHALRLWQLEVLCEMEATHHYLIPALPYPLEVTTLVLVYHAPISIRFRMDEKRFDVDGSYNARFEIIKKRLDKAHIKDTGERIVEAGKLTIVYSSDEEEAEYRGYLQALHLRNLVAEIVEIFDVEDLQGVVGLRAMRARFIYRD